MSANDDTDDANKRLLNRAEVAKRLGISQTGVRRLQGKRLHPHKDESGVYRFDAEEVDALALEFAKNRRKDKKKSSINEPDGELAARVFRELERGGSETDLVKLVIKYKRPPEVFYRLFRDFMTPLDVGARELERKRKK